MTHAFEERHRATYSFTLDRPVVVEALLRRGHRTHRTPISPALATSSSARGAARTVSLHTGGAWRDVPLHRREELPR